MDKVLEILILGFNLEIEQKKEGDIQVVSVRAGRKLEKMPRKKNMRESYLKELHLEV